MVRPIDADALKEAVNSPINDAVKSGEELADAFKSSSQEWSAEIWTVEDKIDNAPTVETKPPVRRGEWEWSEYVSKWECSNCWHAVEEEDANTEYEFCPYCGAKMGGES